MAIAPNTPLSDLYRQLIAAWNDRDAETMASLYAPNGVQIGFDGSMVVGAKSILDHLSPVFRDHPTQKFVFVLRKITLFDLDYGLLHAIAGMTVLNAMDIDASKNVIQTMLARKYRGKWKIELFQNTPARFDGRPKEALQTTAELQQEARRQFAHDANGARR